METVFGSGDAEVDFLVGRHGVNEERAVDIANWMAVAAPLLTELPHSTDVYDDSPFLTAERSTRRIWRRERFGSRGR